MNCRYCNSQLIKAGLNKRGAQRYRCKLCLRYQLQNYRQKAREINTNVLITQLTTEGVGIRSIARILKISTTTVISRIQKIAKDIQRPTISETQAICEIDEVWTFIRNKANHTWITYVFDRTTKNVIDFTIGSRTKEKLTPIVQTALSRNPIKICTDGLRAYQTLVPAHLHRVGLLHTRRIERYNLNLRTHLKRLTRKTICFSKSFEMLESCLRIYFWSARNMSILVQSSVNKIE